MGARAGKQKLGATAGKYKLGAGTKARAGGQAKGRGPGNTNTLNTDNCHHFLNTQEPNTLKIDDLHTNNSLSEKLLSINFDCKLKFNKPITDICQKVSQKLHALVRLAPYNRKTYFYEYIFQNTI